MINFLKSYGKFSFDHFRPEFSRSSLKTLPDFFVKNLQIHTNIFQTVKISFFLSTQFEKQILKIGFYPQLARLSLGATLLISDSGG